MAKRLRPTDDFDSPWKDALHRYLRFFLTFFFPDIHDDVDWSRGYQALDKEFQQIVRQAKVGKRLADKLFKLCSRTAANAGCSSMSRSRVLTKRLRRAHVCLQCGRAPVVRQDRRQPGVLCDERLDWRPTTSATVIGLQDRTDVSDREVTGSCARSGVVEGNDNPFATVVLAHLQAVRTRGDHESRRQGKLRWSSPL